MKTRLLFSIGIFFVAAIATTPMTVVDASGATASVNFIISER